MVKLLGLPTQCEVEVAREQAEWKGACRVSNTVHEAAVHWHLFPSKPSRGGRRRKEAGRTVRGGIKKIVKVLSATGFLLLAAR